jgi:hypothetical protein
MSASTRLSVVAYALLLGLGLAACGGGGGGGGGPAPAPGAQITELAVDISTGFVTVTGPATHLSVMGAAADTGGGTAIVDLEVLSNYPRLLFNLKAVVTAISDGAATGSGLFAGDPYVYYGPNALAPGAIAPGSFMISGLTGTTFTMTIEWLDHPMVFVPGDNNGGPVVAMDSSGSGQAVQIDTYAFAFQDLSSGNAGNQGGCVSPDGQFLYLSPRNQPGILTVDLTTMSAAMGTDLSGGMIAFDATGSVGFLDDVQMSPDGLFLYALMTLGAHAYSNENSTAIDGYGGPSLQGLTSSVEVIKLDRMTQDEIARVTLGTGLPLDVNSYSQVGKGLSLSPSGARLAAAIRNGGQAFVVETAGMTIFDADLGTVGDQGFATTTIGDQPRRTLFRDEDNLLVGFAGDADSAGGTHDSTMLTIHLPTRTLGTLAPAAEYAGTYTYNYMGAVRRHPDGRMFIFHPYDGNFPSVAVYDFGTGTWTTAFDNPNSFDTDGAAISADGKRVYIYARQGLTGAGGDTLVILDAMTLQIVPMEATGDDEVSTVAGVNSPYGHTCIVTPF